MKIAIIGPSYPFRGGLAANNDRMAIQFQDEGHDVVVYTFTLQYPKFLFPGKTQYSTDDAPFGIEIIRSINSVNPINWLIVGRKIKKQKFDLVLIRFWLPFMGPCFGTLLRIIKSNKHTMIISIVDNIIPHEKRIGDKLFTKYFIKPVNGFIGLSQIVVDDIGKFDSKKPKALSPHPLFDNFGKIFSKEEAAKILGLDSSYRYILFFGLIRKYKGLDLLLQAFADDRFRKKKIKLIIAGEYYVSDKEYLNLINKYKLDKDIIHVNRFIPDSEVANYFNMSDLVVQPYKSATQSGVTQIAYHFNKPMIVTNVGGLAEICPDGKVGYVVPVDHNAIADAIIRFFEETNHAEMIKNIQTEKKKYSWNVLTKNIFKMFDAL